MNELSVLRADRASQPVSPGVPHLENLDEVEIPGRASKRDRLKGELASIYLSRFNFPFGRQALPSTIEIAQPRVAGKTLVPS